MTADCGIRGDAKEEMRSCWTYVKRQSRRAKSCKGSEPRKRSDSRFTLLYAILPTLYRSQGFRTVLVKENLRFQFSPASGLTRLASPAKPKVWRLFCLTAVTCGWKPWFVSLGKELSRDDLS